MQRMVLSRVIEHQETIDVIVKKESLSLLVNKKQKIVEGKSSATPESVQKNNQTTLNVRSSGSENITPNILSSLISGQGSISRGVDCKPYWNMPCQVMSRSLWLPTATDSVVLDGTSSSGLYHPGEEGLSLSLKTNKAAMEISTESSSKISSQSSQFSDVDCMDVDQSGSNPQTKEKTIKQNGPKPQMRKMMVKLFPTKRQERAFRDELCHPTRMVLNEGVSMIKNRGIFPSMESLKPLLVSNKREEDSEPRQVVALVQDDLFRSQALKKYGYPGPRDDMHSDKWIAHVDKFLVKRHKQKNVKTHTFVTHADVFVLNDVKPYLWRQTELPRPSNNATQEKWDAICAKRVCLPGPRNDMSHDQWVNALFKLFAHIIVEEREAYEKIRAEKSIFLQPPGPRNDMNQQKWNSLVATRRARFDVMKMTPTKILGDALGVMATNHRTNLSKLASGNINKYQLRFYTKKKKRGLVTLPLQNASFAKQPRVEKNDKLYVSFCQNFKLKDGTKLGSIRYKRQGSKKRNRKIPDPRKHGGELVYKEPGQWYLCINYKRELSDISPPKFKDVSLDPGGRTFQTMYSSDGEFAGGIDGPQRRNKMNKLRTRLSYLNSLRDSGRKPKKTKRKLKEKIQMTWNKIKNIVNDLHWKSVAFLVNNFENINIGKLGVQSCLKSLKSCWSKWELQMLSHYKFRQRLLEFNTVRNISVVDESCSSKTCSVCGSYDHNLGIAKTYNCKNCRNTIDRDDNGAVNIYIKKMVFPQCTLQT